MKKSNKILKKNTKEENKGYKNLSKKKQINKNVIES